MNKFSWLTDKELVVLSLTYGINEAGVNMGIVDQARVDGVSPKAVRARLRKALDKLRQPDTKEAFNHLAGVKLSDLSVSKK